MNPAGILDIVRGLNLFRYWSYLSFIKLQIEFQKTKLSLMWEPLTVFFVSTVLSIVWSEILDINDPKRYFFYILVGFSLWSLLFAKLINRAVTSLARRSHELTVVVKPVSVIFFEEISYSFQSFFIALPFVLAACLIYLNVGLFDLIAFSAGLILIWLTALGLCLTLGILAFSFRDIVPFVRAAMRLGFLTTPIIWMPERLGEYEYLVWFNPFFSYLEICRSALMGEEIADFAWVVASSITLALILFGLIVYSCFYEKVKRRVFS